MGPYYETVFGIMCGDHLLTSSFETVLWDHFSGFEWRRIPWILVGTVVHLCLAVCEQRDFALVADGDILHVYFREQLTAFDLAF